MSENQSVLPGDVIITGDYNLEQNVISDDNKIISTAIGFSEIENDVVSVNSLTGFYIPKADDLIVGKVISHNALSWEIDINSYTSGLLMGSDIFGKDYSAFRDDLSLKLKIGDIILARIVNVGSRDPFLTIVGENLGKIDSGELVKISPAKIPRLIGKHESKIQTIETSTNATITVGQNGLIILKCNDSTGLKKAIKSLRVIGNTHDDSNIEGKIKNILDGNN